MAGVDARSGGDDGVRQEKNQSPWLDGWAQEISRVSVSPCEGDRRQQGEEGKVEGDG